jgi:spore coat protein B
MQGQAWSNKNFRRKKIMTISREKLRGLDGHIVNVNWAGPEKGVGVLLGVQEDYLALHCEDGVVYYLIDHIKECSINSGKHHKGKKELNYIKADCFVDMLRHWKHRKVKINRGGPHSVTGVISEVYDDHVELTVHDDVLFITCCHIKSVCLVEVKSTGKKSTGKKSSGKKGSGKKSSGKSDKKSSGKKSSGKKSSGKKSSGKKSSGKCSKVSSAWKKAVENGSDHHMFNDPYGSSGHSSCKSSKKSSCEKYKPNSKKVSALRELTSLEKKGWIKL